MGFKKTSEGRVFFKSPDNDDAPSKPIKTSSEPVINKSNAQMQILLLLKSLNTKLKSSKDDRESMKKELVEYKATIKSLEEKTNKQQSDYIDLEQKVANKQNEVSKKTSRVESTVKSTLEQLKEAKELVKQLEEKSNTQDKSLKEIKTEVKKKIDEQGKQADLFEEKQKSLEATQKDQGEKMVDSVAAYVALTKRVGDTETRQDNLDNKIEDATSEYLKLDRKIDKVIEDRNRILRKVERIEQAVLETRDALNAKAMVLLTDQGVAGVDMPQITDAAMRADPMALQRRLQEETMLPWWRKPVRLQATSLVLLMLAVLLLGWIMNAANNPVQTQNSGASIAPPPTVSLKSSAKQEMNAPSEKIQSAQLLGAETDTPAEENFTSVQPDFRLDYKDTAETITEIEKTEVQDTPSPTVEAKTEHGITIHKGLDDPSQITKDEALDINNDAQMLAAMEKNPAKVAQRLNQIEPDSINMREDLPPQKTQQEIASAVPQRVIDNAYKAALKRRIKPDPNLTDKAKQIERKAFEGVPEAQHDMGAIYVSGHGNIERDLDRAITWFQEAANNGVANAKYNLGVLYHQGMGVTASLDKAMELYIEAADMGHPEAQYNLGIANIEGIGVPYNPQKAAQYFEKAAKQNITEAAYNLGLIHENGLLGQQKPDIALTWYKHAADAGSPEAQSAMEQLAASLGVGMDDINRIIENVKKSDTSFPNIQDSKSLISRTQNELMRRGLYPGPVDGVMGPMTRNAIEAFQKAANLDVTGETSVELLQYLSASSNYSKFQ